MPLITFRQTHCQNWVMWGVYPFCVVQQCTRRSKNCPHKSERNERENHSTQSFQNNFTSLIESNQLKEDVKQICILVSGSCPLCCHHWCPAPSLPSSSPMWMRWWLQPMQMSMPKKEAMRKCIRSSAEGFTDYDFRLNNNNNHTYNHTRHYNSGLWRTINWMRHIFPNTEVPQRSVSQKVPWYLLLLQWRGQHCKAIEEPKKQVPHRI